MDKTSKIQSMALSRRTIVTGSVAGAAGAAVLLGLVTEASAKMAQKAVEYQDTPKGDQECSNCSLSSRSRTPARWSMARSVRRAGVNSGSKRQASAGEVLQTHIQSDALPPW